MDRVVRQESETSELAYDMFNMNDINSPTTTIDDKEKNLHTSTDVDINDSGETGEYVHSNINLSSPPSNNKQNMARATILMLITLGIVAGLVNGLIVLASNGLSHAQAMIIHQSTNYIGGLFAFLTTSSVFVFIAAYLCKHVSNRAAGSGLPELKALLAGELKNENESKNLVSSRALFAKIFGLILALGSSLSIGSEGPLVHTASCLAYFLMRHVYEFEDLLNSPALLRQIYVASTAVGVSSTFNAPVGGLLFSIEVTSTFYLVSNYWRSFIAAVSGSLMCNLFLIMNSHSLVVLPMELPTHQFAKWEYILFIFLGVVLGYAAFFFLKLHQEVNILFRPYASKYPLTLSVSVGIFTAFVVYVSGAYSDTSVSVLNLVHDLLNSGNIVDMSRFQMPAFLGILISLMCRILLTLVGTNIPVPAGIFMPVYLIGGLMGRFFGMIIQSIAIANGQGHTIVVPTYALVGCVAFAAGVTHTISAAIIAVELTGNLPMLLPCLLVATIASGITKHKGLSVYDQGMLNKGLESLQLLLMGSSQAKNAQDVMDTEYASININCTARDLIDLLDNNAGQTTFPVTTAASMDISSHSDKARDAPNHSNSNSNRSTDNDTNDCPEVSSSSSSTAARKSVTTSQVSSIQSQPRSKVQSAHSSQQRRSSGMSFTEIAKLDSTTNITIRLTGTISRRHVYLYLKELFIRHSSYDVLRALLPLDTREDDIYELKCYKKAKKLKQREEMQHKVQTGLALPQIFILGEDLDDQAMIAHKQNKMNNTGADADSTTEVQNPLHNSNTDINNKRQLMHPLSMSKESNHSNNSPVDLSVFSTAQLSHDLYAPTTTSVSSKKYQDKTLYDTIPMTTKTKSSSNDVDVSHTNEPNNNNNNNINNNNHIRPQHGMTNTSTETLLPDEMNQALEKYHHYQSHVNHFLFGTDESKWQPPPRLSVEDREVVFHTLDWNLHQALDIAVDVTDESLLRMNAFPLSVNEVTPMEHIYILFEMVKVSSVFVVSKQDGSLKGMICREHLLHQLSSHLTNSSKTS